YHKLEWIPCSEITDIKSTPTDAIYFASRRHELPHGIEETMIIFVLLGSDEICTPTFVREFSRIYSLPTHKYDNNVSQYRRYTTWLGRRNKLVIGFTKYDNNYY